MVTNMLDALFKDIILNITTYLNNKDEMRFLSSTKNLHDLKNDVYYENIVAIRIIHQLWYFDRFTNAIISELDSKLPKSKIIFMIR